MMTGFSSSTSAPRSISILLPNRFSRLSPARNGRLLGQAKTLAYGGSAIGPMDSEENWRLPGHAAVVLAPQMPRKASPRLMDSTETSPDSLIRKINLQELRSEAVPEVLSREWLLTNGLGGYASGTISGHVSRRYHGLLIAALPSPLGRIVMLNHLAEFVVLPDGRRLQFGGEETNRLEGHRLSSPSVSHGVHARLSNPALALQHRWHRNRKADDASPRSEHGPRYLPPPRGTGIGAHRVAAFRPLSSARKRCRRAGSQASISFRSGVDTTKFAPGKTPRSPTRRCACSSTATPAPSPTKAAQPGRSLTRWKRNAATIPAGSFGARGSFTPICGAAATRHSLLQPNRGRRFWPLHPGRRSIADRERRRRLLSRADPRACEGPARNSCWPPTSSS